jgi:hypothetical protein
MPAAAFPQATIMILPFAWTTGKCRAMHRAGCATEMAVSKSARKKRLVLKDTIEKQMF